MFFVKKNTSFVRNKDLAKFFDQLRGLFGERSNQVWHHLIPYRSERES